MPNRQRRFSRPGRGVVAGVAAGKWLPAAGLLALSTVFLFVGERDYFHKDLLHNEFTAKNMALARNLSAERGLLFENMRRNADGTVRYGTYHRFPIGAFVLIKLAIAPFEGDFAAQLLAARTLMLAFFCAAAALAYLALARLTGSRAVALGATLLAFSSHHLLHYSDVVSNEASVDLFAVMLVFHGMVLFHSAGPQRRRFWQLAAKVCAALLLGWHVYGLLLPFLALGVTAEAAAAWRGGADARRALGAAAVRVLRGRHALLGALALVFGSGVLGYNFAREYAAFDGRRPVAELPSVRSMLSRTGTDAPHFRGAEELKWPTFVRWQFHRVGVACVPVALAGGADLDEYAWRASGGWWFAAAGVVATIGAFAGLALFRRSRAPPAVPAAAAALALAGFCWAFLARGNAAWADHQHEGIFHVGVPLVLFAALLLAARRLAGGRAAVACGAVAVAVFCASSVAMVLRHLDEGEAQTARARLAEFDAVARMIRGKTVWVTAWYHATRRFVNPFVFNSLTAGGFVRYANTLDGADPRVVAGLDFVLAFERHPIPALLTPSHRFVFLYRGGADIGAVSRALRDGRRRETAALMARAPAAARPGGAARPDGARAGFDVHVVPKEETARAVRGAGELVYLKAPCGPEDTRGSFFLRLVPADANLPWEERRDAKHHHFPFGHNHFPFATYGVMLDGMCTVHLGLPTWPVAVVYTGHDHPAGAAASWRVAFRLDVDRLRAALRTTRGEAPAARGEFDLYMRHVRRDSPQLLYVREPCTRRDVRRRFFLHVVPDAAESLPRARRRSGFANLDFAFGERGALVDGACVATVELPDYDIARLRTGQFDADACAVWRVEFAPDAAGAGR